MLGELLGALQPQLEDRSAEIVVVDNCADASARPVVEGFDNPALRYVHEGRSGVVHARNRGVAEARGTYVIFLDDDEVPVADWLDAWLAQADGRTDASFARIVPRLLGPCPPELVGQVMRNFSRDMHRPNGSDITDLSAYVGTGNAMFHRSRCLGQTEPFDLRFNARGGEDVWLIRSLVKQGRRLLWNSEALVEELVPESRMTLVSLQQRRFNQGQLRCIVVFGNGGPRGALQAGIWMMVGAIQFLGFSAISWLAGSVAPGKVADFRCRASGGAGKLLWWRQARSSSYSAD